MVRQIGRAAVAAALFVTPLFAQEAVPGPLRVYVAVDERTPKEDSRNRTDRMHCPVVENGLNPVAVVLSRTVPAGDDAPAAKLIRELGKIAQKGRASNAAAAAVFLTLDGEYPADDKRAEKVAPVKALAGQLKSPAVLYGVASTKGEPGTPAEAWKVGDADDLVVVIYHRMQVAKKADGSPARWAYPAGGGPSDDDVKAIIDTFEREVKAGS